MGIFKKMFGADKAEAVRELENEKTVFFIREEYERRKKARMPFELQWTLNANFVNGNQYCDINIYRQNGIEQFSPDYKWREREVFNRIAPIIETRVGLLQKINYKMIVKPRRNDIDDYAKADIATKVLGYQQDISDFNAKKNQAIVWAETAGNCFFVTGWNKEKGEIASIERLPEGNAVYHEGEIEYSLLSPYEVYPEDVMVQGVENQRSIMIVQVMSVKEAYDRYAMSFEGRTLQKYVMTPKAVCFGENKECSMGTLSTESVDDAVRIITYYERKSREEPKGRMVVMADTEGPGEIIFDTGLPYDEIPIAQMVSKSVPGQFFGKSVIEQLIPLQRAYNGVINSCHEWIKRLAVQSYTIEAGSVDEDKLVELEEEGLPPGTILPYQKGFAAPRPFENGNFPSELIEEREQLKQEMEYVAGVSQMQMTGDKPSGITSGTAIESLREIDNTRMAMTGENLREAVMKLAKIWLRMYKRYARFPRVIRTVGLDNIGEAITWCAEDITSYEIEFETENELTLSEEAQKQNFMAAVQMGAFTDNEGRMPQRVKNKILECMKAGSYTDIIDINGLQLKAAQRENTLMRQGMWQDINEYDDDAIHAEEHLRFILSMEFKVMQAKDKAYAKMIEAHWRAHKARAEGTA